MQGGVKGGHRNPPYSFLRPRRFNMAYHYRSPVCISSSCKNTGNGRLYQNQNSQPTLYYIRYNYIFYYTAYCAVKSNFRSFDTVCHPLCSQENHGPNRPLCSTWLKNILNLARGTSSFWGFRSQTRPAACLPLRFFHLP